MCNLCFVFLIMTRTCNMHAHHVQVSLYGSNGAVGALAAGTPVELALDFKQYGDARKGPLNPGKVGVVVGPGSQSNTYEVGARARGCCVGTYARGRGVARAHGRTLEVAEEVQMHAGYRTHGVTHYAPAAHLRASRCCTCVRTRYGPTCVQLSGGWAHGGWNWRAVEFA